MQPVVSVIIPTYNRSNYLKRSIQSVLEQTFTDFEVIVINNFSTDNTLEIIASFADTRIKVYNFKNDGIIAKSRNKGIMHSVGKYIAFLDDDDLWCPDKLELQVKVLNENSDKHIIYSNAIIVDEHDARKVLLLRPEQPKVGQVFSDLVYENFVPILTVLIRREVYETIGPFSEDADLRGSEDYEYWLRASLVFNFEYMNKELALYRVHGGSISGAINRPLLWQKVLRRFLVNSEVLPKYKNEIINSIERINSDVSVYYWSISEKKEAKDYAKKYVVFNMKHYKLINMAAGMSLFVLIHFQYSKFAKLVNFAAKIRRPLGL